MTEVRVSGGSEERRETGGRVLNPRVPGGEGRTVSGPGVSTDTWGSEPQTSPTSTGISRDNDPLSDRFS